VKDRVVQMAALLVLGPIFEADFHPRSYGFRPGRNAHEALDEIVNALRSGRLEVVDALVQVLIVHWPDHSARIRAIPFRTRARASSRSVPRIKSSS